MNFKKFLVEYLASPSARAELAVQKILDNINDTHVDTTEDSIEFNIGDCIEDSFFSELNVIILLDDAEGMRLAKHKERREPYIVISVTELPDEFELEKFFSSKKIHSKFTKLINEFYSKNKDKSPELKYDHEKKSLHNDKKSVRNNYKELIRKVKSVVDEFDEAAHDLQYTMQTTANEGKRATAQLAIEKLKAEYFGKSSAEFLKKAKSYDEGEFINHLDKDARATIDRKLVQFFNTVNKRHKLIK